MLVPLTCMCAAQPSMSFLEPLALQSNASECKRRQAPRHSAKSHELPATRRSGPAHYLKVFPLALSRSLSLSDIQAQVTQQLWCASTVVAEVARSYHSLEGLVFLASAEDVRVGQS
jgi:hypothetical protein